MSEVALYSYRGSHTGVAPFTDDTAWLRRWGGGLSPMTLCVLYTGSPRLSLRLTLAGGGGCASALPRIRAVGARHLAPRRRPPPPLASPLPLDDGTGPPQD